ncbi:hypothetical protein PEPS_00290 [Persicobacter psychrovividus]|uniref:DUF4421 domain-containing protein n=2 Tax=Persicobacter psychrovividus TaxID=387638 RepID=A0ABN6L8W7_9BACT|nr:hypothetical protein PEPS_00290 [Persicobacter psychrovividus]
MSFQSAFAQVTLNAAPHPTKETVDDRNFIQRLLGIHNAVKWSYYDSSFITDYSKAWTFRFLMENKFNQFLVFNHDRESDQSLLYEPTPHLNLGFGFNHNWLGVNTSFSVPSIDRVMNNENEINTSMFDIQVNVYDVKLVGEFRLQRYKGYYINHFGWKLPNIIGGHNGENFRLAYPNLTTNSFTGNLSYIFNWKQFSYRASYIQTQRQLKSAGSWMAGISYFANSIYNDGDGILGGTTIDFPEMNFQKSVTFGIGLMGGYGYTYVLKKNFYISLTMMPGISYNYTKLTYIEDEPTIDEYRFGLAGVGRFSIGYNKASYFFGLHSALQWNAVFYDTAGLNNINGSFRFVVGKRFNWQLKGKFFHAIGMD